MTGGVGLYCDVLVAVGFTCRHRKVGHFGSKFQTEGGVAHQPLLVSENYSNCPVVWYQNIRSALFGFVTKYAFDRRTDGRTDGPNYDSQDRASIAASRCKIKGTAL